MHNATRATDAASEISRINAFFPIMPILGNRWAASRPFEGLTIGISAHLTTFTAALVRELQLGGGQWVLCGASDATTDLGVVKLLRSNGLSVYTTGSREDALMQVLEHEPSIIADVGADLIGTLVQKKPELAKKMHGAVEVTKSGANRLRTLDLPFGVVNINDGRLKPAVENRHGVGEGLWQALQSLTGIHLSGRRVGVIGYGPVGRGIAAYARAAGANVQVVEQNPIRRLVAHYDGFPTLEVSECLERVGIVVTCTGQRNIIGPEQLSQASDGMVLANAGHGGDEIDVSAIKAAAVAVDQIADHVVNYKIENGPSVIIMADGHPLNIVTNAGSPEPVLLHFGVLGLTLEWLTRNSVVPGEASIPQGIEEEAAQLALHALSIAHG